MLSKERRELLVRVARLGYLDGLTQARIGQKLQPQKKQPAVAKLLEEAESLGIVRYEIDADAAITGEADRELSDDLRKAFGLDSAYAVEIAADLTSDEVPIALANFAAEMVRRSLRSNDHIAVAGGRTIARLCRALTNEAVNVHHVVVTPLGGRLWSGHLWKAPAREGMHFEQPLNPDDCALILAQGLHGGLQPEITFSQVSHPLFANSIDEAEAIIRENCAFRPCEGWNWKLPPPSQAFVGVGMLTAKTHHRLAEWLESRDRASTPPIVARLAKTRGEAEQVGLPEFGDVANRLFVSLPLASSLPTDPNQRSHLLAAIQRLDSILLAVNRQSVVMDWSHLRDINSVLAIAGGAAGALKLEALWTLLLATTLSQKEQRFRLLTGLVTDSATAKILVEQRQQLRNLGKEAVDWYASALRVLFPKTREQKAGRA